LIKNCLFDWSGTLVDDFLNVYKATALAFNGLGLKAISLNRFRREFKLPYMDFWHKYLPNMTPAEEKVVFLSAWDTLKPSQLFPFVHLTLSVLRGRKINLVLFSSHDQDRLEKEVKLFGLEGFFREINGSVLDKVAAIKSVLARNNFAAEETMFIGDMTHDIEAGHAAGIIACAIVNQEAKFLYETMGKILCAYPDYLINDIRGAVGLSSFARKKRKTKI